MLESLIYSIHLSIVSPLVKSGGSLIIFQTLEDCTVDDDFVILNFATNDARYGDEGYEMDIINHNRRGRFPVTIVNTLILN